MDLTVTRWGARLGGRPMPVAVGRGGIGAKRGEGDGITPRGRHRLLFGFWRADRARPPRTALPLMPVPPWLGWCDAPGRAEYNRPVRLPHPASAERMRRADRLYDLVVVLDWNFPEVTDGAGSAIFLHAWRAPRHPTAGCVALAPRDLARVLAQWRPEDRLVVR